jgi:hypothetical protein
MWWGDACVVIEQAMVAMRRAVVVVVSLCSGRRVLGRGRCWWSPDEM